VIAQPLHFHASHQVWFTGRSRQLIVSFSRRLTASAWDSPAAIAMGLSPVHQEYARSSQAFDSRAPLPASLPKSLPTLRVHQLSALVPMNPNTMWQPCIGPSQVPTMWLTSVFSTASQVSATNHLS